MGCNCNKRKKRVLRQEEMIADRAARIASANPQVSPPAATPAPTWNPVNGPRPESTQRDTSS